MHNSLAKRSVVLLVNSCPKILVLFSAPLVNQDGEPIQALDIAAERKAIIAELSKLNRELYIRFDFATVDSLARGIKDGYNILHFSGHGNKQFLAFEDDEGGCHPIDGPFLKKLIGTASPFELAVISACFSEEIANMVYKAGVKHVVAINRKTPILDLAATKFAGAFYSYLFNCDSVQKSFDMAKILVEGDSKLAKIKLILEAKNQEQGKKLITEENKFVLLPRNKPSFHQDPIWRELAPGSLSIDEQLKTPNNIPVRARCFLGRSRDIHGIVKCLSNNRLVTITGVGGIGKTAISIEVSRWFFLRNKFRDGIFVINARESSSSNRIIDLLGTSVGKQFTNVEDFVRFISSLQILVVIDNAEDLLYADETGTQTIINELLKYTSSLHILVTSQRQLGGNLHEAEHILRLRTMGSDDSIELFASTSKRELTNEEYSSLEFTRLMEQLGGHPLSIVIMAKQLTYGVTIIELNERIEAEKAKAITINGISDRQSDHGESLIASLLTSYNNLDTSSKELFTCLSLLPAGAFHDTIESIFGKGSWRIVHQLADTSLVEIEASRVSLLPPVRLFATNFIDMTNIIKFGPTIVKMMRQMSSSIYRGLKEDNALNSRYIFAIEEPNLRGAVGLPIVFDSQKASKGLSDTGELIHNLMALYYLSYRLQDAINLGNSTLSVLSRMGDRRGLARVTHQLGVTSINLRNNRAAKKYLKRSLKLFKQLGDKDGELNSSVALGTSLLRLKEYDQSRKILNDAIRKAKQFPNEYDDWGKNGEANAYRILSSLDRKLKDYSSAKQYSEKALSIYKDINQKLGEAAALFDLGELYLSLKDNSNAKSHLQQAIQKSRIIGAKDTEANSLFCLARVYLLEKNTLQAKLLLENAVSIFEEIGDTVLLKIASSLLLACNQPAKNHR